MKISTYIIHGFIEVRVDAEVEPEIFKAINFQIGGFLCLSPDERSTGLRRINVVPYARLRQSLNEEGLVESVFHLSRGVVGNYCVFPEEDLVIVRTEDGYAIGASRANFLINLYIQLLLCEANMTMCHAAAYESKTGDVTIVAGAGGIGKTALLSYAVREKGLRYLGDDIVILSASGRCFSFPRYFVLKKYHRSTYPEVFESKGLGHNNAYAFKRFIVENAPLVGVTKSLLRKTNWYYRVANLVRPEAHLATVPPDVLFGPNAMCDSGLISRIIHLDRVDQASFSLGRTDRDKLASRLMATIHHEWKDFMSELVTLGAMGVIGLSDYLEGSISTFRAALNNVNALQLDVPISSSPTELFDFFEEKKLFD